MKKIIKHLIITFIFVVFVMIFIAIVQKSGENVLINNPCSYIDKEITDILAVSMALFLIIEGLYRMIEHKDYDLKYQLTRILQVGIGGAIITLHIMQFFFEKF